MPPVLPPHSPPVLPPMNVQEVCYSVTMSGAIRTVMLGPAGIGDLGEGIGRRVGESGGKREDE